MESRQGCSFRTTEFGIEVWPEIVVPQAALDRRAEAAAAKRRGVSHVSREDVLVAGTQESISTAKSRSRRPARPRAAPIEPPLVVAGLSAVPKGPTMAVASTPVEGRAYGVFIEPLDPYLSALSDSSVDGVRLENLLVGLRAIRDREEGEAFYISRMVRHRRRIINKVARRIQRRIGVDTTDDALPSSSEDDSDDEDWSDNDDVVRDEGVSGGGSGQEA